jgi:hypothetical protein
LKNPNYEIAIARRLHLILCFGKRCRRGTRRTRAASSSWQNPESRANPDRGAWTGNPNKNHEHESSEEEVSGSEEEEDMTIHSLELGAFEEPDAKPEAVAKPDAKPDAKPETEVAADEGQSGGGQPDGPQSKRRRKK